MADAVLWRPLPYPDDERIALVGATFPNGRLAPISPPMFFDWQEQNRVFDAMAGVYRHRMDLTGRSEPVRLQAAGVSSELAEVLTVRAQRGRWFAPAEDEPGGPRVVVLSDAAWRNLWAADSSVVGMTVVLNEEPWTVIGVLPRDFHPPEYLGLADTQIWFPMSLIPEDLSSHANWFIRVLGKLRSGVSITAAQAEMQTVSDRLRANYPDTPLNEHPDVQVRSLRAETLGDSATTILMLLGAVLVLLLIACANVANLVLARTHDRRGEVALRLALGAGRGRILRQLVTENLFLSLAGGAAGLGLAIIAVRSFIRFNPGDWPRLDEIGVDMRVAGFALFVAVLTGLLFGIGPAMSASRSNSQSTVAGRRPDPSSNRSNNRFRLTITGAQTAMALVLLIGAGLLMNSFVRLQMVEPGFSSEDVAVMRISLSTKYETREQRQQMFESVLENLRSIPVVSDAGFSSGLPFGGGGMMGSYVVEGRSTPTTSTRYVPWQLVSNEVL